MSAPDPSASTEPWLAGGGAMGARVRAMDWSATSLGPRERWPQSLRSALSICLGSRFPMVVLWGPQLVMLYNDAYAPLLGDKHPGALGRPIAEVWSEIAGVIAPMMQSVIDTGEATWIPDGPLTLNRHGVPEETYFSYSFGPVRIEDGSVGGILAVTIETTQRVMAERRMAATLEQERKLANAERDLRRVFEQAPSFVCIMNGPQHVFEFVNNAHRALFNSASWIGKPIREAFPDISGQGYFEELDKVYRTGARYIATSAPVRYRYAPGSDEEERLLDFIYEAIRDEHGVITGIFCEGFDVTAQRRAEESLRKQEGRLRALIHSGANAVYSMSADWKEMRTLQGQGFIADTQAPDRSWLEAYIHPDDQPMVLDAIQRAIENRGPFQFEHRVRTVDGTLGWTSSRAVPIFDAAGEVTEWFGAASDITPRKKMEAELDAAHAEADRQRRLYEAILTNTPDLAYVFDLQHRFIYANEVLLQMWGKTREEAIGRTCLELGYEPWHAEMHNREIDQIAATGKSIRGVVPFNGTFGRRIYDYILVPVFGAGGEVVAVAGTTRDITEIQQLQETLSAQAEQLREGDQRKDEFIGILAHELRNPLAPLKSGLEVIGRLAPPADEALHKARAMMERQLAQMVRLIDDLLDVSRISSGKIGIRKAPVALGDVLRQAVETSQPMIGKAGHELLITQPGDAVHVDADATRLAQVFSNLLTNAAKFTPRGGRIDLTTELDGDQVRISVRDNGEGIPADMLERIFELFVQVDRSLERDKSGLGIGLSLARGLVTLHGGSIEARSSGAGRGSEFIVRLPVAAQASAEVPQGGAPASSAPQAGRRVLVVDDNVDAASSLAMVLDFMGCETRVAHNGADGVAAARDFQPQIAFLDIGMPGMNGYEACAAIRSAPWGRAMKLVALTGWGQDKDRQRSREAGFDSHLVKPVGIDGIESVLSEFKA